MQGQIYLTGFMGSGKSTVARCLQNEYGLTQLEMDARIVEEEGMAISRIFAEKGEAYFRQLETELLRRLSGEQGLVVSCGGGTVMRPENVALMKRNGVIVLLTATPETIYERVKENHDRPLLEGNMNVDYIRGLMEQRRPKYEAAADFAVQTDGKTAAEICAEIVKKMDLNDGK